MARIRDEEGLTFDDLLLVPQASSIHPRDVSLKTRLTKNIELNIPILSAAMDTVTEHRLAIALAQQGGLGIIHKNLNAEEQALEVEKVKRSENGIIPDPKTLQNSATVGDAQELMELHHISGIPVLDGKQVVGIVTRRDLKYQREAGTPITEVMTTELVWADPQVELGVAKNLMYQAKVEKLILKEKNGDLNGIITIKDLERQEQYPEACHDSRGRLRVGAAVGVYDYDRVDALVAAGVDLIVVDSAHGHSDNILNTVKEIKSRHEIEVMAGNIATAAAARDLITAGVDAVKVGIGPGSICTTRVIAGVGVPQLTAIMDCAEACKEANIPLVADGGIKYSGDVAKALAAGAQCVMLGSMFAGTEEAPGEQIIFQGRNFKSYRGMGSIAAMKRGSADRYFQDSGNANKLVAEGIEGMVPFKGGLSTVMYQITGGLRSSLGYCGALSLPEFHEKAEFIRITNAGLRESHPHDVKVTKEAPNYRADN